MGSGPAGREITSELRGAVPRVIVLVDASKDVIWSDLSLFSADAFLLRPLDERQLLARLAEVETSSSSQTEVRKSEVYCFEDCRLDLGGRIFIDSGGREIPLTRSEAELLTILVRNPKRVLSRDELRHGVAGQRADAYDRNVDVLIGRLRRKIEPDPKVPRFILTVSGAGYKLNAATRNAEPSDVPSPVIVSPELEPSLPNRPEEEEGQHPNGANSALPSHEPERRQVTVLCCGLAGLTTLAGYVDLEALEGAIGAFRHAATAAIEHWGGSIARLAGEEILAQFGYPHAHEDDAERAVQAGLDLISAVADIRVPWGEPLQTQGAITTGLALVGREQEIVGEPPILAARLRATAPPNKLIVTAATHSLIRGVFDLEGPVECEVDEVAGPIMTYRVSGRRPARTRFETKRTGKLTPFVGRQKDLQHLRMLWARARGGKGQVALICGEPGIGKSRMFEAFLDGIAGEPHIAISCQCSPHHGNSPFHPIISQLEGAAGFDRRDTPEIKLRKLERMLSQAGPSILADKAFYAALLSIPTGDGHLLPELTPRRQRDLTMAALVRQALALSGKKPLIIRLEDVHWVDSSTLELFSRIVASVATAPVLVVVTYRPEFTTPWLQHPHVSIVRLDRLDREQARDMVLNLANGKLSNEVSDQIIAKTDGVPLFVEELTKTVLEFALREDPNGDYNDANQLPPTIPLTLADSLTARLDKLGQTKEIAQIGSAIGREFSYGLLAAVAPMPSASLRSALAQLAAPELIFVRGEPPDATYMFKHALVRDAAYAMLSGGKRRQLHGLIARALEERFPETIQTQPELIAHHLMQAGLPEPAIDYLRKAGQQAIEQSANSEAIAHLTRALELLDPLPENPKRLKSALRLQAMLGQAMIALRGYAAPRTMETLLRAKALINELTDSHERLSILYGLWAASYVGGVSSEQKSAANELLTEAQRHNDPAALCVAHRALGTTSLANGDFGTALRHLERALGLYDPKLHADLRHRYGQDIGAAALCYLSWTLWHLGSIGQARKAADAAVRRAEEVAHPHTLVYTICHARGVMSTFQRRADDLQSSADRVVALCAEHGLSHWMNCGRIFQGWAAVCGGELERGIDVLVAGIAAWRGTGARLWLPTFLTLEAEAHAKAGRSDAALQAVEQALAASKETGETWANAEILRIKARLLLDAGKAAADEIEALLLTSLEISGGQGARCFELRAACDLARMQHGQHKADNALSLLRPIYDQFTEGLNTPDLKEAGALIRKLESSRS
jgi:DNA-binding response OmpR family regulator/class 3 adenylate cyclase/predicted ATPase